VVAIQIKIPNHIPKCELFGFERSDELEYPVSLGLGKHIAASKITTNAFMWVPALAGTRGLKPAPTNK